MQPPAFAKTPPSASESPKVSVFWDSRLHSPQLPVREVEEVSDEFESLSDEPEEPRGGRQRPVAQGGAARPVEDEVASDFSEDEDDGEEITPVKDLPAIRDVAAPKRDAPAAVVREVKENVAVVPRRAPNGGVTADQPKAGKAVTADPASPRVPVQE